MRPRQSQNQTANTHFLTWNAVLFKEKWRLSTCPTSLGGDPISLILIKNTQLLMPPAKLVISRTILRQNKCFLCSPSPVLLSSAHLKAFPPDWSGERYWILNPTSRVASGIHKTVKAIATVSFPESLPKHLQGEASFYGISVYIWPGCTSFFLKQLEIKFTYHKFIFLICIIQVFGFLSSIYSVPIEMTMWGFPPLF